MHERNEYEHSDTYIIIRVAENRSRQLTGAFTLADVIYQHPLAYLLGLEGVALLRAFTGEHDREFVQHRLSDIRQLLETAEQFGPGVEVPPITSREGYARWAPSYDEPGNGLIELEQPLVRAIVDGFEAGVALDAACGTGRHTEYLVARGHRVIAVDNTRAMLTRAAARVPQARFHQADLLAVPLPDASVDLVVCALALTHVADLDSAFAELARVLRPGGHLVTSDAAGLAAGIRPPITLADADGKPGYLPHYNRGAGDYVRAALAAGLDVRRCEEPRLPDQFVDPAVKPPIDVVLAEGPPNIWWLHHWFPDASNAALRGEPAVMVWHFQRGGRP